jgi:hypothetical protein
MEFSEVKLYYKLSFQLNYIVLSRILRLKDSCESNNSINKSNTLL